jgi:hypothetical protein
MDESPRIKSYSEGIQDERARIKAWIEEHRTYIEIEAGIGITRDHFTSNDLVAFIDSKK